MSVKKEEDEKANLAEASVLKKRGLEHAARKQERKDRIVREDAEKKAALDAEIQKLMAKKAELEGPAEPKEEPIEEEAVSATFLYDFVAPPGFRLEGKYLVIDKNSEANKDFEYELEYD
jgi:hypothetical protein